MREREGVTGLFQILVVGLLNYIGVCRVQCLALQFVKGLGRRNVLCLGRESWASGCSGKSTVLMNQIRSSHGRPEQVVLYLIKRLG